MSSSSIGSSSSSPVVMHTSKEGSADWHEDAFSSLPTDVKSIIFSYLSLYELETTRRVSRAWNACPRDSHLWQKAIYREFAFSGKDWNKWDNEILKDVDLTQEYSTLPENIVEQLRLTHKDFSAIFPEKSIRETHVLVRMPEGLTLNKLGELAKRDFPENPGGYSGVPDYRDIPSYRLDIPNYNYWDQFRDKCAVKPVWLLMTRDIVSGFWTSGINPILAKLSQIGYEIPTILEAATCILAEYSKSKMRLLGDKPCTYTICQESIQPIESSKRVHRVVIGGFSSEGLDISLADFRIGHVGIVALKRFVDPEEAQSSICSS